MNAKRKSTEFSNQVAGDAPQKMLALSVRQPWAELIMSGEKEAEYRRYPTQVRDTVYVYAGLKKYRRDVMDDLTEELGLDVYELDRGVLVGTVEVYDCEETEDGYAWLLQNPVRFEQPLTFDPNVQPQPAWFYPFGKPE